MNRLVQIIEENLDRQPLWGAEIGVSKGGTSAILLQQFPTLKLWMIDAWDTYSEAHPYRQSGDGHARLTEEQQAEHKRAALKATEFAANRRDVIHADSAYAAQFIGDGLLDFGYFDGDHTEAAVAADIRLYWPKLRPGGVAIFDDVSHPRDRRGLFGVTKAMTSFAKAVGVEVHKDTKAQKGWLCKPPKTPTKPNDRGMER